MTVRALSAGDAALLDDLIAEYEYKPYRNHRLLSRDRQTAVMREEISRTQQVAGSFALLSGSGRDTAPVSGSGQDIAIAVGRPLAWDSVFFGVAMGRLDYLLRGATAGRDALGAAVAGALDRFRALNIKHVALKLDVADADALMVVEDQGFRLMDAIVTYIAHPKRDAPRAVKDTGRVRPFAPADSDHVLDIAREAYRGYRGRYQVDPHLPPERSAEFYLEWARQCCSGQMADRMLVAEDSDGRLIGWASVKNAEPASSVSGTRISVGSLGACRPETPGAYATLISAVAAENHAAGVLTEAQTQNSNFAMIRVLESVGAQYARGEYTFHAWLG